MSPLLTVAESVQEARLDAVYAAATERRIEAALDSLMGGRSRRRIMEAWQRAILAGDDEAEEILFVALYPEEA